MAEIDDDTMAGMSIEIVETAGGRFVRMRRHDKLAALALLGRYFRLFEDDPNAGATVGLAEYLAEHRARASQALPDRARPAL